MKYIMRDHTPSEFAIFPDLLNHREMANRLGWRDIIGAGFVRFGCGDHQELEILVDCYGESISLGVKSRGDEDAKIIQNAHRNY